MEINNKEQFLRSKAEIEKINERITLLLEQQNRDSFEEICNLLETERTVRYAAEDQKLYVLQIMTNIQRQEMAEGETRTLFEGRNIQSLVRLYRETVFYLRRLEFDLPKEEQMELIGFMLEEQLSAVCIFGIIQAARYIYAKEKTLEAFLNLLEMM